MAPRQLDPVATVRSIVGPALWGLRAYWGTCLLLATASAVALAALLPVTALVASGGTGFATRLDLPSWRGHDLGMVWSTLAWSPTGLRRTALVTLVELLLGVATGVVAVAGLTILSLSIVRASGRAPEFSLRRAVGGTGRLLLASTLLEGGAIAAAALLLGGVAGAMAARSALAAWPGGVGPASRSAAVLGVGATLAAIFAGAALPLTWRRRSSPLPHAGGHPLPLIVPALQLGLSLTALTAAALLQRQARPLMAGGGGQHLNGTVFEITAPEAPLEARAEQYTRLLKAIDGASLASPGTLVGSGMGDVVITDCGNCAQGGLARPLHEVPATHYLVSSDTFRVLGLTAMAGRIITTADRWNTGRVAVVNRALALQHFEEGRAVGRKILVQRERGEWYTVVGVVGDRSPVSFGSGLQPPFAVYLSVLQHPARSVDLFVPAQGDAGAGVVAEAAIRRTFAGTATRVVPATARGMLAAEVAPLRWFERLFRAEGWAILAVATLGTFVVMRLWVASLWYEFGLRRAVGARRRDIFWFLGLRAAGVALGGIAIGLWCGVMLWGALAAIVPGLPVWDVQLALRSAPLLLAATGAGALLPAWQVARATPVQLVSAQG